MKHNKRGSSHKRQPLSLEVKVRAIKLWKIDNVEPREIVESLETTFGIKIAHSNWERPKRFLKRIEEGLIRLCEEEGPHTDRLIKLLKQAQLIQLKDDEEQDEQ